MINRRLPALVACAASVVLPACALAVSGTFSTDQTWSGNVVVDGLVTMSGNATLTIQPGTTVTFSGASARIDFASYSAKLSAVGTAASPIALSGSSTGGITGFALGVDMQHCNVSGVSNGGTWLNIYTGSNGTKIQSSSVSNSGAMYSYGGGTGDISGCTLQNIGEVRVWNSGIANVQNNRIQGPNSGTMIWVYSNSGAQIRGNAIVNGTVRAAGDGTAYVPDKYVLDGNYIHNTIVGPQYGVLYTNGDIRNNVIRGCSWSTGFSGGKISGNVMEAFTPAETAARGNDPTHENILQITDGTAIERNILLNSTYGSIMGIGSKLLANCTIRNNTIDHRGGASDPIYLNHLPEGSPATGLNIRNNLFLRTGVIYDEKPYADTISSVDYNAWAGTDPSLHGSVAGGRFAQISITGKSVGDDGFGMHDVIVGMNRPAGFDPAAIVADPNFALPGTIDAAMLAGTYTGTDILALYRNAYLPVAGSPIINAGSLLDSSDPLAVGRIDIGALEAVPEPAAVLTAGACAMVGLLRRRSTPRRAK